MESIASSATSVGVPDSNGHLATVASSSALPPASDTAPELSILVPVYNEEENVNRLHERLTSALQATGLTYEIIYVDDGSGDRSFALLDDISRTDEAVKLIRFRRNFGQTAAMSAGMDYARGKVLIPMDADLQNDPADIPRLLAKLDEGYDVVSGWRQKRKDDVLRTTASRIANRFISRLTGVALHDYGCSLKAYRAAVIKEVNLYGEMHRFIPAFAAMVGGRVAEIPVTHHPRVAGQSKYGMNRIFHVILDLLVVRFLGRYGNKPIYFFGGAGLWLFGGGVLLWVIAILQRLLSGEQFHVNRNPLFYVGILLFLIAMQFVLLGLLAEMNMRTYHESQGKPTYVIAESRNLQPEDAAIAAAGGIRKARAS